MAAILRKLLKYVMIIIVMTSIFEIMKQYSKYSENEFNLENDFEIFDSETFNNSSSNGSKTLILYAYFEKNKNYAKTLDYFIKLGVEMSLEIDYVFIIQGYKTSVSIPRYPNVKVLKRDNTCYNFGAYGKAIEWLGGINKVRKYDFFVFINPSAIGPILPKYWPSELHWSKAFTSRLVNETHACSTSIVCLSKNESSSWGPRMEGLAFAASFKAVELAYSKHLVFSCHTSKKDAIIKGEHRFSDALLQANMNFDTLLSKYASIDWRVKGRHWNCNENISPTGNLNYIASDFRMTVHPFETIFYQPTSEAFEIETWAYLEWAAKRKNLKKVYFSKRKSYIHI